MIWLDSWVTKPSFTTTNSLQSLICCNGNNSEFKVFILAEEYWLFHHNYLKQTALLYLNRSGPFYPPQKVKCTLSRNLYIKFYSKESKYNTWFIYFFTEIPQMGLISLLSCRWNLLHLLLLLLITRQHESLLPPDGRRGDVISLNNNNLVLRHFSALRWKVLKRHCAFLINIYFYQTHVITSAVGCSL